MDEDVLTDRIIAALATVRKEERIATAKNLRALYEQIFVIRSTGDRNRPVQGAIDDDAKAAFDTALEASAINGTTNESAIRR